ncbi:lipopolysaccharide transporter LptA [Brucepastera parasyntrophica]|uniref:LptA/OstA family protein n=1 Tax=Brucepastera parasyntrophica TaxID=2880008 RepID=UPI002109B01C|nr:LptA/OstA family protein [Brucepastera parasyntrophica]ULQ61091.1 lipopolysaccharide transporter LptA [Brucepastera parasyntrophica]
MDITKKLFCILGAFLSFSILAADTNDISFSADRMSGSTSKKSSVTVLDGNANVTVGTLQINGDIIELSGKDFRYVNARGNVAGRDEEKGYTFHAEELSYDRDTEVASFRGSARLSDSKNNVEASAVLITYNQKTETALLQINVNLVKNNIECKANFVLYRRGLSLLDLSGSPLVIRDGDEFRADRISVNLDTEQIILDGSVSGTLKDTKQPSGPPASSGAPSPSPADPVQRTVSETPPQIVPPPVPEEVSDGQEEAGSGTDGDEITSLEEADND